MKEEQRITVLLQKPKHEVIVCLVMITLIGIARIWVAELRAASAGNLHSQYDVSMALANCATDFQRLCVYDVEDPATFDCTASIRTNPYLRNVVEPDWCEALMATNRQEKKVQLKDFTTQALRSMFLGASPVCDRMMGRSGYCGALFESVRDLFSSQGYDGGVVDEAMEEAVQEFMDTAQLAPILGSSLPRILLEPVVRDPLPPVPGHMLSCLREHYNNNKRLLRGCEQVIHEATFKMQHFEFRMDFPLAHMAMYLYLILAAASLHRLGLPLGHPETARARHRRRFVQMLADPVLRRHVIHRAEQQGKPDIEEHMAKLDATAAQYVQEDAMTDDGWKEQEGKREAWKNTIAFMWNTRRACCGATLFSLVLLVVDSPATVEVIDVLLVVSVAFLGTYCCLPANPYAKDSDKDDKSSDNNNSLTEPLLNL